MGNEPKSFFKKLESLFGEMVEQTEEDRKIVADQIAEKSIPIHEWDDNEQVQSFFGSSKTYKIIKKESFADNIALCPFCGSGQLDIETGICQYTCKCGKKFHVIEIKGEEDKDGKGTVI